MEKPWRGGEKRINGRAPHHEVSDRNTLFRGLKAAGRLGEGTPGAEIHPHVAPQPTEAIITKRRVGAFSTTDLESILRAHQVTRLVLLGIATARRYRRETHRVQVP